MTSPLRSLDDTLADLLARARPVAGIERVPVLDACARVLAADQRSTIDVPSADNTQMDGYAMRAADVPAPGTRLRVSQRIAAGLLESGLEQRAVFENHDIPIESPEDLGVALPQAFERAGI